MAVRFLSRSQGYHRCQCCFCAQTRATHKAYGNLRRAEVEGFDFDGAEAVDFLRTGSSMSLSSGESTSRKPSVLIVSSSSLSIFLAVSIEHSRSVAMILLGAIVLN